MKNLSLLASEIPENKLHNPPSCDSRENSKKLPFYIALFILN